MLRYYAMHWCCIHSEQHWTLPIHVGHCISQGVIRLHPSQSGHGVYGPRCMIKTMQDSRRRIPGCYALFFRKIAASIASNAADQHRRTRTTPMECIYVSFHVCMCFYCMCARMRTCVRTGMYIAIGICI